MKRISSTSGLFVASRESSPLSISIASAQALNKGCRQRAKSVVTLLIEIRAMPTHLQAETLRAGRGMTIENFGTFSFHQDFVDLGNVKHTQVSLPLAKVFCLLSPAPLPSHTPIDTDTNSCYTTPSRLLQLHLPPPDILHTCSLPISFSPLPRIAPAQSSLRVIDCIRSSLSPPEPQTGRFQFSLSVSVRDCFLRLQFQSPHYILNPQP